ncbi:neuromedin U [Planctomycetota bacterium]
MTLPRTVMSILVLLAVTAAGAQDRKDTTELAKTAQNPVADLVSLPVQYDINGEVAGTEQYQSVFNIQGIYPFHVSDRYNLITRGNLPIISQPGVLSQDSRQGGIGDVEITALFSPVLPGKWIWGAGPVATLPTASKASMGTDKLGLGLAADVLRMHGPWVYGAKFNNVWGVAGSGNQDSNRMHLQPFVNYNFSDGWYAVSAPTITANWEASSGNQWTIPIGAGAGKVFYGGSQPMNAAVHYYYNLDKPSTGSLWTLRLYFQLLFPKHR